MRKRLLASVTAAAVIGAGGLSIVKASEGLRTSTYLDPVGIPTVCYGHTGPDVRMGQTYTRAECEAIVVEDIAKHRAGIERCITAPLTSNQRDAAVSLAFNIGVSRFCGSTLARKLNREDYIGAADEFPKWKYAGGRVLRGLVTRRAKERALFLTIPAEGSHGRLRAILR